MRRLVAWMRLEGETPRERLRRNPVQLLVLAFVVWFFAIGTWVTLSAVLGDAIAAVAMLGGAVIVGVHLRRWLVGSVQSPSSNAR